MKNKVASCIIETTDSQIKLEENQRKIIFENQDRRHYFKVQVDGCIIKDGVRCDKMLLSQDEREEYYVELKGTDVVHAIEQLKATIMRLGEFDGNRHSYVVCTNVAPAYNTRIQAQQLLFKKQFNSELLVRERQLTRSLY